MEISPLEPKKYEKEYESLMLVFPDEVRAAWKNIPEEDYPLLMAEYSRKTFNAVDTIRKWVVFFGILVIIPIILLVFVLLN